MELHRAIDAAARLILRTAVGVAACAGVAGLAWADSTPAPEFAPEAPATQVLHAPLDKTIALRARGPVGKVVVSQPETIEVGAIGTDALYVIGKQFGETNLLVYDADGQLSQTLDVQVGFDADGLRDTLAEALPDERIAVTAISSSLVLDGAVSSPAAAAIAETLAQRAAPDSVISRLAIEGAQVSLEVRIVEASSRRLRDISSRLSLTQGDHGGIAVGSGSISADTPEVTASTRINAGGFDLDAALTALESRGEARVIAQPTLVAYSGKTASFRAGGELPYPLPERDGVVTLEFRPYGAAVAFAPTIRPDGLIRVAIDAELSAPDPSVSITLLNFTVPGLTTRRVTTVADLRAGESFMLAGLFEQKHERAWRGPLWLMDSPLIGPAVRALRDGDSQRELAVIVTPRIGVGAGLPRPPEAAPPAPARAPKAASGPRGPPVRLIVRELKEALTPPARWLQRVGLRAFKAVTGRA